MKDQVLCWKFWRALNTFCIIHSDNSIHVLAWCCCCPNLWANKFIIFYVEKVHMYLFWKKIASRFQSACFPDISPNDNNCSLNFYSCKNFQLWALLCTMIIISYVRMYLNQTNCGPNILPRFKRSAGYCGTDLFVAHTYF